jgi:hypothetical protein
LLFRTAFDGRLKHDDDDVAPLLVVYLLAPHAVQEDAPAVSL